MGGNGSLVALRMLPAHRQWWKPPSTSDYQRQSGGVKGGGSGGKGQGGADPKLTERRFDALTPPKRYGPLLPYGVR